MNIPLQDLLWTCVFISLGEIPGVEFLVYRGDVCLTLYKSVCFLKYYFVPHPAVYESSRCSTPSLTFVVVSLC